MQVSYYVAVQGLAIDLACRWTPRGNNGKNEKLGQWGSRGGHVTQFCNYGTPQYLGNGRSQKLEIWHAGGPRIELTEKMKN